MTRPKPHAPRRPTASTPLQQAQWRFVPTPTEREIDLARPDLRRLTATPTACARTTVCPVCAHAVGVAVKRKRPTLCRVRCQRRAATHPFGTFAKSTDGPSFLPVRNRQPNVPRLVFSSLRLVGQVLVVESTQPVQPIRHAGGRRPPPSADAQRHPKTLRQFKRETINHTLCFNENALRFSKVKTWPRRP